VNANKTTQTVQIYDANRNMTLQINNNGVFWVNANGYIYLNGQWNVFPVFNKLCDGVILNQAACISQLKNGISGKEFLLQDFMKPNFIFR
jgi:hypothetical protein